jgi:hypothetical protein
MLPSEGSLETEISPVGNGLCQRDLGFWRAVPSGPRQFSGSADDYAQHDAHGDADRGMIECCAERCAESDSETDIFT